MTGVRFRRCVGSKIGASAKASPSHPLTHPLPHSPTPPSTYSLTHSLTVLCPNWGFRPGCCSRWRRRRKTGTTTTFLGIFSPLFLLTTSHAFLGTTPYHTRRVVCSTYRVLIGACNPTLHRFESIQALRAPGDRGAQADPLAAQARRILDFDVILDRFSRIARRHAAHTYTACTISALAGHCLMLSYLMLTHTDWRF